MNQSISVTTKSFRKSFKISNQDLLRWFPGHMTKALSEMQRSLKQIDCVIEVHDARIPLSGRDPYFFKRMVGPKPHILVLNKKDLINSRSSPKIVDKLRETGISNVIFTNSKDQHCWGLRRIVPLAADLISNSMRYNRQTEINYKLMVIGIPNVGKSSVINALRSKNLKLGKCAPVGGVAGITKAVQQSIRVANKPTMFLVDTPGILSPSVPNAEVGMKIALCSCLPDHIIGIQTVADYALYYFNKNCDFSYVDYFDLKEPDDNIVSVLAKIAKYHDRFMKIMDPSTNKHITVPDMMFGARHFVSAIREAKLGRFIYDNVELGISYNQQNEDSKCS